jgi:TorA maturation chaperone TorD
MQGWVQKNKGISDEAFQELRVDHTRLFVGVGKVLAPPWESVYFNEDRMVFQKQTLEVSPRVSKFRAPAANRTDNLAALQRARP